MHVLALLGITGCRVRSHTCLKPYWHTTSFCSLFLQCVQYVFNMETESVIYVFASCFCCDAIGGEPEASTWQPKPAKSSLGRGLHI
jgi:hypothetical protein